MNSTTLRAARVYANNLNTIDDAINQWMEDNPSREIYSIQTTHEKDGKLIALIFYRS